MLQSELLHESRISLSPFRGRLLRGILDRESSQHARAVGTHAHRGNTQSLRAAPSGDFDPDAAAEREKFPDAGGNHGCCKDEGAGGATADSDHASSYQRKICTGMPKFFGSNSFTVADAVRTVSEGVPSVRFSRAEARSVQIRFPPTRMRGVGIPSALASPKFLNGAVFLCARIAATPSGGTPTAVISAGLMLFTSNGPIDPHTERQSRKPPLA